MSQFGFSDFSGSSQNGGSNDGDQGHNYRNFHQEFGPNIDDHEKIMTFFKNFFHHFQQAFDHDDIDDDYGKIITTFVKGFFFMIMMIIMMVIGKQKKKINY